MEPRFKGISRLKESTPERTTSAKPIAFLEWLLEDHFVFSVACEIPIFETDAKGQGVRKPSS